MYACKEEKKCSQIRKKRAGVKSAIQRQADPASDPFLLQCYADLMRSPDFQYLDNAVMAITGKDVLLETNPNLSGAQYFSGANRIGVTPTGDPSQARSLILFEMHNAFKSAEMNANGTAIDAGPSAGAGLKTACKALSIEWLEWGSTAETAIRSRAVNTNLGEGTVKDDYYSNFLGQDVSHLIGQWTYFPNYLEVQKPVHTIKYDKDASSYYWVGEQILSKAKADAPQAMHITDQELHGFYAANLTGDMKDRNRNPFTPRLLASIPRRYPIVPIPVAAMPIVPQQNQAVQGGGSSPGMFKKAANMVSAGYQWIKSWMPKKEKEDPMTLA